MAFQDVSFVVLTEKYKSDTIRNMYGSSHGRMKREDKHGSMKLDSC